MDFRFLQHVFTHLQRQALEAMKTQGIPASDKKYATMVKLLRSQNLAALGFVKQQPSPAAPQQAPPPPPSTAVSTSATSELPAVAPGPVSSATLAQMNEELQQSKGVSSNVKTGAFSAAQVHQLKAQILAYRYLTHNVALPQNLLIAIRGATPSVRNCIFSQFLQVES